MNTRPDERLPYRDLARQGARVSRSVPGDALKRLADVAPGYGTLSIELAFSLDQDGRSWVTGSAEASVEATCQRCLESFATPLWVGFELCIVKDAGLASELANDVDVLAVDKDAVTLAEVVEDELILAVPERLCTEEPCPYAPALSYPAPDAPEPEPDENPFHALAVLKR
ncbi:MAG: YceD family protein [Pseudomonadota bacterium]